MEGDREETDVVDDKGKDKQKIKINRHFAYDLIESAFDMEWEDHEVANLIILIAKQLNFDNSKLIKCLEKTSSGSPGIIAILVDNGYEFTAQQLISLFLVGAGSVDKFIAFIGDAMECKVFDLKNPETLSTVSCIRILHFSS